MVFSKPVTAAVAGPGLPNWLKQMRFSEPPNVTRQSGGCNGENPTSTTPVCGCQSINGPCPEDGWEKLRIDSQIRRLWKFQSIDIDQCLDMDLFKDAVGYLLRQIFYDLCGWLGHVVVKAATLGKVHLDWEKGGESVVASAMGLMFLLLIAFGVAWATGM